MGGKPAHYLRAGSIWAGAISSLPFSLAAAARAARCAAWAAALLLSVASPAPAQAAPETQFSQEAKAVIERNFAGKNISYLLVDASGAVLAERWPSQHPISPGSLVKPFLAVAYGEQHGNQFPTVRCLGTSTRCWLPAGHGPIDIEKAIAQSCNAYFLALAAGLDRERAALTFARYGLTGPAPDAADESLVGLGSAWKETPMALTKAYLALVKEQQSISQGRIVKGMMASAARGTAREVDSALGESTALAKTGTAVCSHLPQASADGFTVVVYPSAQPRLLLLVRVHGVTGAESAKVAAAMLRSLGVGQQAVQP